MVRVMLWGRYKNTNFYIVHIALTDCLIKYISNIYGGQSEKYC
jgi:hypothetical protein